MFSVKVARLLSHDPLRPWGGNALLTLNRFYMIVMTQQEKREKLLSLAKTLSLDSKMEVFLPAICQWVISSCCAGVQKNPEPCALKTSILPPNCVSAIVEGSVVWFWLVLFLPHKFCFPHN